MVGNWNWPDARNKCNNLPVRSHPVIVDSNLDASLVYLYLETTGKACFFLWSNWNYVVLQQSFNIIEYQIKMPCHQKFNFLAFRPCQRAESSCPFWTSGISYFVNNLREPFQWNPLPGVSRQFKNATPWMPGEPKSLFFDSTYCVQMLYKKGLDDCFCSKMSCVICEYDMGFDG